MREHFEVTTEQVWKAPGVPFQRTSKHVVIHELIAHLRSKRGDTVKIRGDEAKRHLLHVYANRAKVKIQTCTARGWIFVRVPPDKPRLQVKPKKEFHVTTAAEFRQARRESIARSTANNFQFTKGGPGNQFSEQSKNVDTLEKASRIETMFRLAAKIRRTELSL